MTNLDHVLKSRDITLLTKVHLVKTIVFPVVMYGCESWTIKKAECQRIDPFKLWCWRRLLRIPWTARRSNQSILKEISPEYSLEGLMLKLQLMWRVDSLVKGPDAGKDWRQEEKGTTEDEMVRWHHRLNGREFEQALGVGDEQTSLASCSPWGRKELDTTEQLNWSEAKIKNKTKQFFFAWYRINHIFLLVLNNEHVLSERKDFKGRWLNSYKATLALCSNPVSYNSFKWAFLLETSQSQWASEIANSGGKQKEKLGKRNRYLK